VTLQIDSPETPSAANPSATATATRPWRSITATPRVGFVSGVLEGTGGLELFELAAAQGLARRGWDVVCVYDEPGDLLGAWTATADVHAHGDGALRDVDVLYVHDVQRLPAAIDTGRRHGLPIVCHLHLPPFHLRSGLVGRLTGRHRFAVDEDVIGRRTPVDRFIAVSHRMRRMWVEAGLPADRVEVVHNGVDLDRFRPAAPAERAQRREALGLADEAFVVGYVGRLERMKGIGQLFDAFRAVDAATDRPMRLLIVGGPSRPMAGQIGSAKDAFIVHLHRSAPRGSSWLGRRADVPELMRALDLVVVPSQWDEPFGLVAVEAMASGVPVVGTRKGGLAEVLAGPLAVNAVGTSPRAIARAIRRHVDDPVQSARLGAEGRRIAQSRFDVNRTVQEIERVLRGVT
jgi:glycosyltransferase involved in cell wall biosynthesis